MMRIKEAIQRKKLIHEMNEEWRDLEYDIGPNLSVSQPTRVPSPMIRGARNGGHQNEENEEPGMRLTNFVMYLSGKLTDLQKRALKITWRRLSEAPKTSGRGTLHIMEKVLTKLCEKSPGVTAIFYKSAFLSCIEDRKCGRVKQSSIATIRDHAHILITLVDDILHLMFEGPLEDVKYDPDSIGEAHSRLGPLGFERSIWHVFGECFAEVMFMQECIRAYPHAPSAWSLLAVALTDRIFSATKLTSSKSLSHQQSYSDPKSPPPIPPRKTDMKCPFFASNHIHKRSLPSLKPPPVSVLSLDSDQIPYLNDDDNDMFVTARSHFDNCSTSLPIVPQRRLPTLTTSVCDERAFDNPRKYSEQINDVHNAAMAVISANRRAKSTSDRSKFLRSKSEVRIKVKRNMRIPHESTDV